MDTTWLLRPNIKWHDGTPMTSDDLLFSFTVIADPEIPNQVGAPLRLMASATAPDPYTFVVHWSAPYIDADQAPGLTPMPRHILGEIYRTDKAALPIHPWMTTDFVARIA
jgi:peptide/nickel transport system substrate-binding protein